MLSWHETAPEDIHALLAEVERVRAKGAALIVRWLQARAEEQRPGGGWVHHPIARAELLDAAEMIADGRHEEDR
jgi:hypothetical protein